MSGAALHVVFDIAAWLAAGGAAAWLSRAMRIRFPAQSFALPYIAALVFGAGLGAYLFGTLNLFLSGSPGLARSVEGAIAGGIVAIELYKWRNGISLRTGARFALPLAIGIAVGRLGCFFAGLDDFTYGTPTTLPWATISATASRAIRSSSTRAGRWLFSRLPTSSPSSGKTVLSSTTAFISYLHSMARSDLSGNS
jgi:hypothetical protein